MKRRQQVCACGALTRPGQADCNPCHARDMRGRRAMLREQRRAAIAAQDAQEARAFERMRTKVSTIHPPEANPQ